MYRFALALIVAAARPDAAVSQITGTPTLEPTPATIVDVCFGRECIVGEDSTCAFYEDTPKCCPLPPGRRRRLNFYKSEPTVGCCQAECD